MKKIIITILYAITFLTLDAQDYEWYTEISGVNYEETRAIATDANGNIYTTGYFQSLVNFDPGLTNTTLSSNGLADIFILKTDANGNFIWVKQIGSSDQDSGLSISIDNDGNVLTSGYYSNTVDFDPSTGIHNLTSGGSLDMFVLKLDSNGNFIWVRSVVGNAGSDVANDVVTDASNNVYIAGDFLGTIDFDPSTGTSNLTSSGNVDIFVQKLDVNGNFVWAKSFGSVNNDYPEGMTLDNSGNLIITGTYKGTVDFDPGAGTNTLTSISNSSDIFVVKLTSLGDLDWVKSVGSSTYETSQAITVDNSNNIIVSGLYQTTVDFDPNGGVFNLTSNGNHDIFILKLNDLGGFVWAKSMGGSGFDRSFGVSAVQTNDIYITGSFNGTVDFDPNAGVTNLLSNGDEDIFIQKLDSTGDLIWARSIGSNIDDRGLAILADNVGGVLISGYFQNTIDFDPNAGSVLDVSFGLRDGFTLKLITPCINVLSTDTISACDSLVWIDGNTYYNGNTTATYTFAGGAVNGCDSVVTLNLTINSSTTGIDTQIACSSYTWLNGITYNGSNTTATHILTNSVGCDSVVTLNLTIENIDTTTTVTGATITANQVGATYQWIDCIDGVPIAGATSQSFTATKNGSYSVLVSQGTCSETSACVAIYSVSIDENTFGKNILVYPNPTTDFITLELGKLTDVQIRITDLSGKALYFGRNINQEILTISIKEFANGTYMLTVINNDNKQTFKIVKK